MQEYEAGQIWAIKAQSEAPPLLVFIHRIDIEESTIASVSIAPHPQAEKAGWPRVSHLPISLETLNVHSGKLVEQKVKHDPDFEDGYSMWREKFEAGEAGFFTLTASEAYSAIAGIGANKNNIHTEQKDDEN